MFRCFGKYSFSCYLVPAERNLSYSSQRFEGILVNSWFLTGQNGFTMQQHNPVADVKKRTVHTMEIYLSNHVKNFQTSNLGPVSSCERSFESACRIPGNI